MLLGERESILMIWSSKVGIVVLKFSIEKNVEFQNIVSF
jgi:hypothetical protein